MLFSSPGIFVGISPDFLRSEIWRFSFALMEVSILATVLWGSLSESPCCGHVGSMTMPGPGQRSLASSGYVLKVHSKSRLGVTNIRPKSGHAKLTRRLEKQPDTVCLWFHSVKHECSNSIQSLPGLTVLLLSPCKPDRHSHSQASRAGCLLCFVWM